MAPHKPLDSAHVLRMAQEALEIEARAVQQQAQRLVQDMAVFRLN